MHRMWNWSHRGHQLFQENLDYCPCRNLFMEVGANIVKDLLPRGAMLVSGTWRLLTFRNDHGCILVWFRLNPKAGSVPPVNGRDWQCWFGLGALFPGRVLELWGGFCIQPFFQDVPLNELSMLSLQRTRMVPARMSKATEKILHSQSYQRDI